MAVIPSVKKALYGHTSPETAYLVSDYPYGFRLRCKIRYWIESDAKKGFRFVSQTSNPKKGDAWNAPKKGTYCVIAECLYLDSESHVKSYGITEYSNVNEAAFFAETFPDAAEQISRLHWWAKKKASFDLAYAQGKVGFTLNGVRQEADEQDKANHAESSNAWLAVAASTKRDKAQETAV